ncbi:45 kDa antigen [Taenia solium]|eukprot:TsM_000308000 transcript=TsM_000308000 gene=TsM_000308000
MPSISGVEMAFQVCLLLMAGSSETAVTHEEVTIVTTSGCGMTCAITGVLVTCMALALD